MMKASEKIEELVNTRINGNSIKGNKTYENMIKSLRTQDFNDYAWNIGPEAKPVMYIYKKIDKVEFLRNLVEGKNDRY
jgi:hypothetical protein